VMMIIGGKAEVGSGKTRGKTKNDP